MLYMYMHVYEYYNMQILHPTMWILRFTLLLGISACGLHACMPVPMHAVQIIFKDLDYNI